ncbi:MAG: hypothetical protein EOO61_07530 [Hymenobacter sp.]|nr:MAG: hypothetical protein EOO61_07530 [Hymenobacter sp.]
MVPDQRTLGAPSFFGRGLTPTLTAAQKHLDQYFSYKQHLFAMIKEAKNVDFYTTGREPSERDFARISAWIKRDKQRQAAREAKPTTGPKTLSS